MTAARCLAWLEANATSFTIEKTMDHPEFRMVTLYIVRASVGGTESSIESIELETALCYIVAALEQAERRASTASLDSRKPPGETI